MQQGCKHHMMTPVYSPSTMFVWLAWSHRAALFKSPLCSEKALMCLNPEEKTERALSCHLCTRQCWWWNNSHLFMTSWSQPQLLFAIICIVNVKFMCLSNFLLFLHMSVVSYVPQAFCDELETMIQDQLKKGKTPTSLLALQQIADFMTTSMPSMYPAAPQGGMAALNMSKQINRMIVGKNLTSALSAVTMNNISYANNFPIGVSKSTFSSLFPADRF